MKGEPRRPPMMFFLLAAAGSIIATDVWRAGSRHRTIVPVQSIAMAFAARTKSNSAWTDLLWSGSILFRPSAMAFSSYGTEGGDHHGIC